MDRLEEIEEHFTVGTRHCAKCHNMIRGWNNMTDDEIGWLIEEVKRLRAECEAEPELLAALKGLASYAYSVANPASLPSDYEVAVRAINKAEGRNLQDG